MLICLFGLLHPARASAAQAGAGKTAWKITGQLEEACSCNAACPCWFDSKPTRMTCSGGQFLFIDKGTYGLVEGGLGGSSKIVNPPGADPLHRMHGAFTLDGEQYENYAAGLAQRMKGMKK